MVSHFYIYLFYKYCCHDNYLVLFPGKHNGTVKGVRYFECKEKHGVFVKPEKIIHEPGGVMKKKKTIYSAVKVTFVHLLCVFFYCFYCISHFDVRVNCLCLKRMNLDTLF